LKTTRARSPEICPVCGEDVPPGSLACPDCGADHNSGWREGAGDLDGLDLPDEEFNYGEFVRQEFGSGPKRSGLKPIWWITAVALLTAFIVILWYSAR